MSVENLNQDYHDYVKEYESAMEIAKNSSSLFATKMVYESLIHKLMMSIKSHMNYTQYSFENKNCYYKDEERECIGDLKFINPFVYLRNLVNGHDDLAKIITPADEALAYMFFMIRAIEGVNARDFQSDFIITFKEGSNHGYSAHDVLDTFSYLNEHQETIYGHIGNRVNKDAAKVLKADKAEVDKLIHNVLHEFSSECNQLKSVTNPSYQSAICERAISTPESPDYQFELFNCLEVFNLVQLDGFCPALNNGLHGEL